MLGRRVYHVIRRQDDSWLVIKEGFKRPHLVRASKSDAILFARRLAKLMPESKVVIHNDAEFLDDERRYEQQVA